MFPSTCNSRAAKLICAPESDGGCLGLGLQGSGDPTAKDLKGQEATLGVKEMFSFLTWSMYMLRIIWCIYL